ncbi:MAG: hypothetical protein ACFE8U_00010 [Candidatus Hermodarchaeota archaeon]
MLNTSKPLKLPHEKENKKTGKRIVVFFLTLLFLMIILSSIGYLTYFIMNYGQHPFYTSQFGSVLLSEEYIGKRDSLTAFGILSILLLALSIIYLGILNYLKD